MKSVRSIALGAFDGIHLGHRALIDRADAVAVIEKGAVLTPGKKRCEFAKKPCYFFDLDSIRHLDARGFVELLERTFGQLERVVVGYDFAFGRDRRYSIEDLRRHFKGEVEVVDEVKVDGISVHSRTIKELLRKGRVKEAARLLGRCYEIEGEPVRGQGLGSRELVPTLNLEVKDYLLPKEGVYLTCTGGHSSLTFIGRRSTDGAFSVESYLLAGEPPKKGPVRVAFVEYLRPNRHFDDLAALRRQIESDITKAKERFDALFADPDFRHLCGCRA
jgi:riboflavin kinase/FMN adenylyltransferase